MASCIFNHRMEAYHDGEITGDARLAAEAHLSECSECAAQLAELAAVSEMFATAPQPRLSQIATHRLHCSVEKVMDRGLLRLGWAMSGIAASLLVVSSICLTQIKNPATQGRVAQAEQTAPPWVGVSLVAETNPAVREAVATPAAEWYLADASTRADDMP